MITDADMAAVKKLVDAWNSGSATTAEILAQHREAAEQAARADERAKCVAELRALPDCQRSGLIANAILAAADELEKGIAL